MKALLSCAAAAALFCVWSLPAFALGSYTQTVTNVTTVTIANSAHSMGAKYFGVSVFDSESVRVQQADSPGWSYSINASTFSVTVNFTSSFTGTVKLIGPFTGLTGNDRDFKVSSGLEGGAGVLKVCGDCSLDYFALRSWASKTWYSAGATVLSLTASGGGGTWRAWLENSKVIFGYSYASVGGAATCSGLPCEVRFSQSGYPGGVIKLGSALRSGGAGQHWAGTPTDERGNN